MEQDKATISYQAAQIIKNDIKQYKGISIKPLCVEDVSIEKVGSITSRCSEK